MQNGGCRGARLVVMVYMVALHMLVFWVMARWSHRHADAGHMGAAELALLCQRQGDSSASMLSQPQQRTLLGILYS